MKTFKLSQGHITVSRDSENSQLIWICLPNQDKIWYVNIKTNEVCQRWDNVNPSVTIEEFLARNVTDTKKLNLLNDISGYDAEEVHEKVSEIIKTARSERELRISDKHAKTLLAKIWLTEKAGCVAGIGFLWFLFGLMILTVSIVAIESVVNNGAEKTIQKIAHLNQDIRRIEGWQEKLTLGTGFYETKKINEAIAAYSESVAKPIAKLEEIKTVQITSRDDLMAKSEYKTYIKRSAPWDTLWSILWKIWGIVSLTCLCIVLGTLMIGIPLCSLRMSYLEKRVKIPIGKSY